MPGITASPTDAVLTKQCTRCNEKLPVMMFYKDASRKDGLDHRCKKCMDKKRIKYEKTNPITSQTWSMVSKARIRAKAKKLDCNIDNEYVRSLVVSHCPIFGIPLDWSRHRGNGTVTTDGSPSLDRIDPSKGYIKGNVWIISYRANRIKNDATHEELKLVTKAVGEAIVKSLEF
jgi:hypothetical protein